MHKYQYTNNYNIIDLFRKSIVWINTTLKKTYKDIFSTSRIEFDGNRMYFRFYFKKNKEVCMDLEFIPDWYKLTVLEKKTKNVINTILFKHLNYTEMDTTTVFVKRVIPQIISIIQKK